VPAPAVIPAPIAYIKVVAVKKLVVDFQCNVYEIYRMAYFNGVFNGSNTVRYFSW